MICCFLFAFTEYFWVCTCCTYCEIDPDLHPVSITFFRTLFHASCVLLPTHIFAVPCIGV